MKPILLVAGARPNFMKIAPVVRALQADGGLPFRIVHTGQHYDQGMSAVFFEDLGIPQPDVFLGAGGGSHAQQTARIMVAFERVCAEERPCCVVVVGDVDSTLACSITARKAHVPVAHVEAGLRSGDMRMPEEINRIVTDAISDLFFVTEPSGVENLLREGKPRDAIHHVGNVMVDNLLYQRERLRQRSTAEYAEPEVKKRYRRFAVLTLHRPSNVDDPEVFRRIAGAVREISEHVPIIFPVHPRTRANMARFGIEFGDRVILEQPLPYTGFLDLWKDAELVLTDSGGLQEETTALGIPCVTIRENTERPVTVKEGTNVLAGTDPRRIVKAALAILHGDVRRGSRPHLWDGKAAERIVQVLRREFGP